RLVLAVERDEGVDIPELADEERRLRHAEVVLSRVAHNIAVAVELAADGVTGLDKAGIGGWQKAEIGQEQHAGVEFAVLERPQQGAAPLIPGAGQDFVPDL